MAGLKSVPKAGRHRLREIPAGEAYRDWRLSVAGKDLEQARGSLEEILTRLEETERAWTECAAFCK